MRAWGPVPDAVTVASLPGWYKGPFGAKRMAAGSVWADGFTPFSAQALPMAWTISPSGAMADMAQMGMVST